MPGKSTCSQLLEALYDWTSGLDVGDINDVVTIDFRKAFDVIPHDMLVHKLIAVGVCEQSARWIASFLSSRKQCVCLNGKYSSISDVSVIVQGSVIGPLLFALYINDLPECCPDCKIKLFADDVKAYKKIRTCNDRLALQCSLNNISTWAKKNKLGISVEKCCYFQVGYSNFTLVYVLDSDHIATCDSIVDLGIHINSSLKFGQHCTAIVSKASARYKLIVKTFLSCDPRAFITYLRPLMEYCTPVWTPYYKKDIDLVEGVQRAFTCNVFKRCQLQPASYNDRLAYLGLERLELRRIHADLIYMFKLTHNIVLSSLAQSLHLNSSITRGHDFKLFINRCNKIVFSAYFTN